MDLTGKEKILRYLNDHGPMRDEDLAEVLKMSPSSARTRRHELELEGILVPVGLTLTTYGRETYLWDIRR
jgi:DNA-binding Lrp family transcriptional regulator